MNVKLDTVKILFFLALVLFSYSSLFSQTMQATLKVGNTPRTVDIYLKPSASFSQKDEAMSFVLAIPATIGPTPTMGSSGVTPNTTGPISSISGLQPTFLVNNLGATSREVVITTQTINGTSYYVYTFIFSGTATTAHNWTENAEQLLFSIQFNGCTTNCSALSSILLASLANGGAESNAYFYFQPNTIGDITNYAAPFYTNVQTGTLINGGSTDGSALSSISLNTAVPLPVRLSAFNARANNCQVSINWQTAGEENAAFFRVERSEDGAKYQEIGTVHASGTTSASKFYSFTDHAASKGMFYYRLLIEDKDGKKNYSPVQSASTNCNGKVTVYPSITPGPVNVVLAQGMEKATIRVLNSTGKLVLSSAASGLNRNFDLGAFAAGNYLIHVMMDGVLTGAYKVVVQR